MVTQVTNGISISVQTQYSEKHSFPERRQFLFGYRIIIENNSEYTVQLMRRHWYIFDSSGEKSEVEGVGVVGEQPVLEPGQTHEYQSACNLTTDMGKMRGNYSMERQVDGLKFEVEIPEFQLITPFKLN
jgi:ApaG protein